MPRTDFFSKYLNLKSSNVFGATTQKVIYNKYVLYFVFFIALFQLLYSGVHQDYLYCILFVLIGFLVHFFNKNMTIILILSMASATIISNVLKGKQLKVEEGLTTKESEDSGNEKPLPSKSPSKTADPEVFIKKSVKEDLQEKPSDDTTSTTSPSALMDILQRKALDLQDAQKNIIKGFEQIEPHMDRAESLISSIETMATKIQGMRDRDAQKQ